MTDKERFEELAYNVGISLDGEKALMSSDDYDFLYNYALEQAERVQELEGEYKVRQVEYLEEHIDRLENKNKRYREAIFKALDALPVGFKNEAVRILGEALESEE